MLVCGTLSRVYTLFCGTSAALSSPFRLYFDVLNPKMFVKTGVFRHSFSCHFFFCVVFKELFAAAFFRITSPFLEKFVRVALLRVPLFSSSCLVLREKSFAKTFASIFSVWLRCCSKKFVRVENYAFLAFSSLRLAIRKISSQKPVREFTSLRVRDSLKTNQCRTAFAARCLDFEICSEVSLASCLLRKEVIQPHLPIRLPCYDFTPVSAPTFDGFPPASGVNDFRGVTGGVYKARERIHRSMLTCDY